MICIKVVSHTHTHTLVQMSKRTTELAKASSRSVVQVHTSSVTSLLQMSVCSGSGIMKQNIGTLFSRIKSSPKPKKFC
jgi:hypothetical protein